MAAKPFKNGSMTLNGRTIDLKNINCSLLVGAGKTDQIVTEQSAKPLMELTSSTDKTFTLIGWSSWTDVQSENSQYILAEIDHLVGTTLNPDRCLIPEEPAFFRYLLFYSEGMT